MSRLAIPHELAGATGSRRWRGHAFAEVVAGRRRRQRKEPTVRDAAGVISAVSREPSQNAVPTFAVRTFAVRTFAAREGLQRHAVRRRTPWWPGLLLAPIMVTAALAGIVIVVRFSAILARVL